MILECGCAYKAHEPTGAMQRFNRCDSHQQSYRDPRWLAHDYYQELINLDATDSIANSNHVSEMVDALGPFPKSGTNPRCLEIGCGTSPYVGTLRLAGWQYVGLDISDWAIHWNATYWGAHVVHADFEGWSNSWTYGLILSAHSLEHMRDAPGAMVKIAGFLDRGGTVLILVPDDRDPANPDHLWLFNESSLQKTVELAGLRVEKMVRKSIVKREDFLYCTARK
jgi:SAM-dependent methyltransferase